MAQFYEWTVKVRIPNYMVAQGDVIDTDRLQEMLEEVFPEPINDGDISAMIIKSPDPSQIAREQA